MRALLRIGPYLLLAAIGAGLALPSPRRVAAPLLEGLVLVAWLGLLRRFILANAAPVPEPARARRLVTATTLATQWFMAILFGLSALPQGGPGLVAAGVGLGLFLLPVAFIATYAGKPPPPVPEPPAPPDGWLFVPRAHGAGLGIDPRHPRFWQAVALTAAGPLAVIAASLLG